MARPSGAASTSGKLAATATGVFVTIPFAIVGSWTAQAAVATRRSSRQATQRERALRAQLLDLPASRRRSRHPTTAGRISTRQLGGLGSRGGSLAPHRLVAAPLTFRSAPFALILKVTILTVLILTRWQARRR
jgi:hypothetical protein